jgi:hypothetical protein
MKTYLLKYYQMNRRIDRQNYSRIKRFTMIKQINFNKQSDLSN